MPSYSSLKRKFRLARAWKHLKASLIRIARRVVVTVLTLQVFTAIVLLLVAALRRRHGDKANFPRRPFDDVQVGQNSLKLYCYGRELYADMLAAIDAAKESIYIESYIWKGDDAGWEFKLHLARKAEEGVDVYVIFDNFGNFVVPRSFKSFHPKIHVLEYQALKHLVQAFDWRCYSLDHRKLLIVDGIPVLLVATILAVSTPPRGVIPICVLLVRPRLTWPILLSISGTVFVRLRTAIVLPALIRVALIPMLPYMATTRCA